MQIILLSGGSGQRLWPLSNDTRSKQFLSLLEAPDGSMESMVQRVVRQIRQAGLSGKITIATNESQREIIREQLGEDIDMVFEPCRRDTFPAIALASCYLALKSGVSEDETIIVMPCDPYTGEGYFKTIGRIAKAVEERKAELVLMGVRPTFPSSKYGYVVPEENNGGVMKVRRFTEKPDVDTARALLEEGALWNGGVFGFRLGYLMDIVQHYLSPVNFEDAVARYSELPKISFDYEVVEKAANVAVISYSGEWKDLGTWNTLCEELPEDAIGKAVMGDSNKGVNVINELDIPVFCDGLKDVIVACSKDGIIVCSKDASVNIKSYVEKLNSLK